MKHNRNIMLAFIESVYGAITPDKSEAADKLHQSYKGFRAKFKAQRKPIEVLADTLTSYFGSINFIILNVLFFVVWISVNMGVFSSILPFDPYPFTLLTTFVSLEAIFLAIIVLISQNRSEQISDLRQEVDFQINMQAEQEVTKVMEMVNEIHQHLGLSKKNDTELKQMMKKIDAEKLEEEIKEEDEPTKAKDSGQKKSKR